MHDDVILYSWLLVTSSCTRDADHCWWRHPVPVTRVTVGDVILYPWRGSLSGTSSYTRDTSHYWCDSRRQCKANLLESPMLIDTILPRVGNIVSMPMLHHILSRDVIVLFPSLAGLAWERGYQFPMTHVVKEITRSTRKFSTSIRREGSCLTTVSAHEWRF